MGSLYKCESSTYEEIKKIGHGGFGQVFLVQNTRDKSKYYALKVITKRLDYGRQELKIMKEFTLNHQQFTVPLLDFHDSLKKVYLVMPYYENGSVRDYVRTHGKLTSEKAAHILKQVAECLSHLHKQNIMHRDITAANVFIKSVTDGKFTVLLGDFGLSKSIDPGNAKMTMCGTPGYMPPEVKGGQYSLNNEVFSLGGLLYFMLTHEDPDPDNRHIQLKKFRKENPGDQDAYELLSKMWESDAENRIKLEEVRRHRYLQYASTITGKRVGSNSNPVHCKHRIAQSDGRCDRCKEYVGQPKSVRSRENSKERVRSREALNDRRIMDKPSREKPDSAYASADKPISRPHATKRPNSTGSRRPSSTHTDSTKKRNSWPLPPFSHFVPDPKQIRSGVLIRNKQGRYILKADGPNTRLIYEAVDKSTDKVKYIFECQQDNDGKQKLLIYKPKNDNAAVPDYEDQLLATKPAFRTITSFEELQQHKYEDQYSEMSMAIKKFASRVYAIIIYRFNEKSNHTAKLMRDGTIRFIYPDGKTFYKKKNSSEILCEGEESRLSKENERLFREAEAKLKAYDQINQKLEGQYYKTVTIYYTGRT